MNEEPPHYRIRLAAISGRADTAVPVLPAGFVTRDHIS